MIKIYADNQEVSIDWITFSDGARTCKVDAEKIKNTERYISYAVDPATDVFEVEPLLRLVHNAVWCVDTQNRPKFHLYLPYLPYGRADRVFEEGNPEPLGSFITNIAEMGFSEINLVDPHNEEYIDTFAVHNQQVKFNIKPQEDAFVEAVKTHSFNPLHTKRWDYIVAPDKGARHKAERLSEKLNTPILTATKIRDMTTGRISSIEFDCDLPRGARVIIVDDICDGGGTFVPLIESLVKANNTVDLYITHMIGSRGLAIFSDLDQLYCYQIAGNFLNKMDIADFNGKPRKIRTPQQ